MCFNSAAKPSFIYWLSLQDIATDFVTLLPHLPNDQSELSSLLSSFFPLPLLYSVTRFAPMRTFVYSLFFFHSPCLSISLRSHSTRLSFHVSFSLILQERSLAKPAHAEICRASNKFTRYAYRVNRMKANANIAVISSLLLFLRDARAFSFDEDIVRTSSQTSSSRAIRAIRKYTNTVLLARLKSICFCGL